MAELVVCWLEANRADDIAAALYRIQQEVDVLLVNDVADVITEIRLSSRILRDLYDLFPIYNERVEFLLDHLSTILPCFRRTLQDILNHIGKYPEFSFNRIWVEIDEDLRRQGDVSLVDRFKIYNNFLIQLVRLLSRSDDSYPMIGGSLTASADPRSMMLPSSIHCG